MSAVRCVKGAGSRDRCHTLRGGTPTAVAEDSPMTTSPKGNAMKKLIVFATLAAASVSANAGFWTGNELYSRMQQGNSNYSPAFVSGFISGVSDALNEAELLCMPTGVTIGQAADIVRGFLEKNPARRHEMAADLVFTALVEHWACKRKPAANSSMSY